MKSGQDTAGFLHGARSGLVRPSWASIAIMVSLPLCFLLGAFLFAQFGLNDRTAHLIAQSPTDHDLFAVAELKSLEPGDTDPLLVIVGASVTRSSFGTNAEIAATMKARLGSDFDVVNLCTSRQSILATIALVDSLPTDRRVLVAYGFGPSRFTRPKRGINADLRMSRLAISSSAEDAIVKELGLYQHPNTGIALIDHRPFYVARFAALAENLVKISTGRPPAFHNQNQYLGRRKSAKEQARQNKQVVSRFENSKGARDLNLHLLDRLIALVDSRPEMSLVMVEHPIKPSFVRDWIDREILDRHHSSIKEVSRDRDVPYWTLGLDLGLTDDSFFDWAHISDDLAQQRLREELAARLEERYDVE